MPVPKPQQSSVLEKLKVWEAGMLVFTFNWHSLVCFCIETSNKAILTIFFIPFFKNVLKKRTNCYALALVHKSWLIFTFKQDSLWNQIQIILSEVFLLAKFLALQSFMICILQSSCKVLIQLSLKMSHPSTCMNVSIHSKSSVKSSACSYEAYATMKISATLFQT